MKSSSYNMWKYFILNISFVILLFIIILFISLFVRNKNLLESGMLTSARAYFNNIVITRSWNARYDGVFVEKKKGIVSNKYLENPDIYTIDGKIYTKLNPAIMTRQISEIAEKDGLFRFHITSLTPLNPNNKADEFEVIALKSFERGEKELYQRIKINNKHYFKYMAPLHVDKTCLSCHAKQGYKIGDIRGGISVFFEINSIIEQIKINTIIIITLGIVSFSIIVGIIFILVRQLNKRVKENTKELDNAYKIIKFDLDLARKIQEKILPKNIDSIKGIKCSIHFLPMSEVGGDIYDITEISPGYIRIFLADATGHGVHAALVTMLIKNVYEKIKTAKNPCELLNSLNSEFIAAYSNLSVYFTAIVLDIDRNNKKISFSSAGHPDQYIISDNKVINLISKGKLMGYIEEIGCSIFTYEYKLYDKILLFTDGLYEQYNIKEQFGSEKIAELVDTYKNKSIKDIINIIIHELNTFIGNVSYSDDVTVIGIEIFD